MNPEDYISWKSATAHSAPSHFQQDEADSTNPILTSLIPRPTAWMAVYPASHLSHANNISTNSDKPLVCLIEGYCGASDRPPTLMLGSDSVAPEVLDGLRQHGFCTLSVATKREWQMIFCGNQREETRRNVVQCMAAPVGEFCGPAKTFLEAGLRECYPSSSLQSILDSLPDPVPNPENIMDDDIRSEYRKNTYHHRSKRPPAVDSSPVQMHCRLITEIPLPTASVTAFPTMILLQVDTYIIHQSILRSQTTLFPPHPISIQGNPDVRKITAKIDCLLLSPLCSLGGGKFETVDRIYHMGRPRPKLVSKQYDVSGGAECDEWNEHTCNRTSWEDCAMWEIDHLIPAEPNSNPSFTDTGSNSSSDKVPKSADSITFTYRNDPHCPLGYNPMKQVVCPRFIGWISTYEPTSLKRHEQNHGEKGSTVTEMPVAHISPYSFFMDVARWPRPMVAFAACPRSDEFEDSEEEKADSEDFNDASNEKKNNCDGWKDAQRDAEITGCFCVNFVSRELAWAMNASAAPLGKGLSEFRLMESTGNENCKVEKTACGEEENTRNISTYVRAPNVIAPMVIQSPVIMECRYVKTTKIPDLLDNDSMYSLIIGEVVNIHARKDCSLESSSIEKKSRQSGMCFELDLKKAQPVARLGYGQEYAVIDESLS